jgi:hypothetical protein
LGLRPRAVTWKAKAEHREVFVPSLSLPLSYTLGESFSFHIKKTTGLYRTPIKKESFFCVEAS